MKKFLYAATALGAMALAPGANAGLLAEYSVDGGGSWTTICTAVGNACGDTFTASNGLEFTVFGATSNSPGTAINARVLQSTTELTNPTNAQQSILLRVGDTDFTSPSGSVSLLNSLAGTVVTGGAGNIFNSVACADPTNSQNVCLGATYQTPIIFSSITTPGAGSNSNSLDIANLTTPYALTELLQIVLDPGSDINSSASSRILPNAVPEPLSLALFGTGLLGLGLVSRKRRQ